MFNSFGQQQKDSGANEMEDKERNQVIKFITREFAVWNKQKGKPKIKTRAFDINIWLQQRILWSKQDPTT